jgi:tRNA A-37 threonylcarbamoyl transferase component Bud32
MSVGPLKANLGLRNLTDYDPNEKGFEQLQDETDTDSSGLSPIKSKHGTSLTAIDRIEAVALDRNTKRELLDYVTDRRVEEIKEYIETHLKQEGEIRDKLDKDRTYLHYAVYRGKRDIVDLLIESGCEVDARDYNGRSPLHYAVANMKIQLIQVLVENGAEVNGVDNEGKTPLHYAALCGYGEIAFKLLCMGADPNLDDNFGMHPLDYCTDKVCEETIQSTFQGKLSDTGRKVFMGRKLCNSLYDRKRDLLNHVAASGERRCFANVNLNDDNSGEGEISHKDFIIHDILGKGSFGEVYLVEKRDTGRLYAMKVFSKKSVQAQNLMRFIYIEKKIMHALNHPFMVKLHYAFQTDRKLYLLMDYCKNRDLGYLLKKKGTVTEQVARLVIAELVLAIEALHSKDIVHRDLKPDNILIDDNGHIMVTDFGLAKEGIKKGVLTKTFCGSIAYLPPEIIKKSGHNKMVDWYLVGIILYELVCGKPPYFSKTFAQLSWNILNAKLAFPPGLSLNTKKFIKRMVAREPSQRLGVKKGAEEIKRHDFFIGIDWEQIARAECPPFDPKEINAYKTQNYRQSIIDEAPAGAEIVEMPNWSFVRE